MNILVIQIKMIGDVLTSTVIIDALKEKYPKSRIHYLVANHTKPVIERHPNIDQIIGIDEGQLQSRSEIVSLAQKLNQSNYHLVIDAYTKNNTAMLCKRIEADTTIGIHKWYLKHCFDKNVTFQTETTTIAGAAIENRLRLVQSEGIPITARAPKIYLSKKETQLAAKFLTNNGIDLAKPLHMISVLGSSEIKTYPATYMAQVLDQLAENSSNAQLLFNYIPKQEQDARAIYDLCKPATQQAIFFEVFGKSLRDFLAITSHCDTVIGNEGGAINMGKALGKRTFTIFSPWILKSAWNAFEDGTNHVSVHLSDFKPEIYGRKHPKKFKKKALKLYDQLKPEMFVDDLSSFLYEY